MMAKQRKILFASVGGIAVIAAITATAVVVTRDGKEEGGTFVATPGVTFEEFIRGDLKPRSYSGKWRSDKVLQTVNSEGNLVLWDVETDDKTTIELEISTQDHDWTFVDYAPNSESLALVRAEVEYVFRYSTVALYAVYDKTTNATYPIAPADVTNEVKLQRAEWLPHQSLNRIIFVYENNIYLKPDYDLSDTTVALTDDGVPDNVYNGVADWVYEEEVLSTDRAMYFTNSGLLIAYARFDDTNVQQFHYTNYGSPTEPEKHQYPEDVVIKYPKSGTTNPTVSLFVMELADQSAIEVTPPGEVTAFGEYLYTAAKWIKEDALSVTWMNRVQNESVVSECRSPSAGSWICETVYTLAEPEGWIDLFQPPLYNSAGDQLLQIQTNREDPDAELHYPHLAKVSTDTGDTLFLSEGDFVVTEILSWNEVVGTVDFMGTGIGSPGVRHHYQVNDDGSDLECVSCDLDMPVSKQACEYNVVSVSPGDHTYYLHSCKGPSVPETALRRSKDHLVVSILEDNADVQTKLATKATPQDVYLEVDVEGGFKAQVRMRLPPDFDESMQYPALVEVYGGPGSQQASNAWMGGSWSDYLINYGVIYIFIDGRGTGFQSNEFLFQLYRQLGTVEMEDQIAVMKSLQDQYSWIDPDRTAIWGWSYGGYATLMTLIQDTNNVFKCGISVAPVTDWLFYDSVYTERFMSLPNEEDNAAGYSGGSLLDKAVNGLRGKTFQLNHGVADDNVHYQQSMMLVKALELADVQFIQQSYPDENHSLQHVDQYLYHSFDLFWSDCLGYEIVDEPQGPIAKVKKEATETNDKQ